MGDTPKVILISGKAGSGKDTAAKIIKKETEDKGTRVLITHYADLVKYVCKTFFNWDGVKDIAGRSLLQCVGTDVVRKHNPNAWVDFIVMILKYFGSNWDLVLIPDCRFPNEISVIKNEGFDTIHVLIERDNYGSSLTEAQQKHESETALDAVIPDFVIKNNGTMKDLENKLDEFLEEEVYG